MSGVAISWLILILYLGIVLYIGYWSMKRNYTTADYFVAGRSLGPWVVAFSYFGTYFSTSAMLGGGGTGFLMGFSWSVFLAFFHIVFALATWYLIAPRLRYYSEKLGSFSLPDFFEYRYKSKISRVVAAIIIIIFFELYMISIYKGIGNLFQQMLNIPYLWGIIIAAIPVIIYVAIGGVRAVAFTDFIQSLLIILGALCIFFLLIYKMGGWSAGVGAIMAAKLPGGVSGSAITQLGGYGPPPIMKAGQMVPFILSLTFAISVAQISSPQLVTRFYAAKDQRVISIGMIIAPVIIGVFALTMFFVGPFGWAVVPQMAPEKISMFLKDPDQLVPFLVVSMFPPAVGAILLAAVTAAAMSTLSALIMVLGQAVGKDILEVLRPQTDSTTTIRVARASMFVLGIAPLILAIRPFGIIVVIVGLAFGVLTSAFVAPLVGGLYWRKGTGIGCWVSMVLATVGSMLWQMYGYPKYWVHPVVPGIIIGVTSFIVISLLTASSATGLAEFKEKAGRPEEARRLPA